jgi:hypothetical protein
MNLFALMLGVAMASPNGLVLRAHIGAHTVWTLSYEDQGLSLSKRRRCKIEARGVELKGHRSTRHPLPSECEELRQLVAQVAEQLRHHPLKGPEPASQADEPRYQLRLGEHVTEVEFRAPEECRVNADGSEDCQKMDLSPAQRLLIKLRSFVVGQKPWH